MDFFIQLGLYSLWIILWGIFIYYIARLFCKVIEEADNE